jgi:hypothetical protein
MTCAGLEVKIFSGINEQNMVRQCENTTRLPLKLGLMIGGGINMKAIIIVYMCDEHHSHSSKSHFGVYTTESKAIKAIQRFDQKVTKQEVNQLKQWKQTQGLDTNYIMNTVILNE